jgi:MFS transporter, ENTS family, enterobactin (siderophore) exporter
VTTTAPPSPEAADPSADLDRPPVGALPTLPPPSTSPATDAPIAAVSPGPGGAEEEPLHLAPAVAHPAITDLPLRHNRDFWVVLVGQGISSFGDAITNTALPILVLALTGSGLAMGVVGVLSTLPDLVVGLPAGAYADRWDRRRMMFVADLGRAVLTALIPISVWLGGPTLVLILLVTFPMNVFRVLWLAAYTAAVPGLVGRGQIARANAVFEAVFNVGWIVGPALAGILAATIGPGPTIAIDAITFAISAGALLLVRRPLRPEARAEPTHLLADIREGIRYVVRQPTLRAVIGLWTATSVVYAGLTSGLIFYITVDRQLGTDVVGLVLSAFAVGSLGGSLVAARMAFLAVGPVMLVGSVVMGLTLVVVALDIPVPVLIGAAFVAGIVNANVLVSYLTLRTQLSPDALLGRVGATARTLSVGLMPVGALAAGALLDAIGGTATLFLMGSASIVAGLGFALLPNVRNARVPRRATAP